MERLKGGYEWEIKDQMAMANVCQGLREAMQEKSSDVDDLVGKIIKDFFSEL